MMDESTRPAPKALGGSINLATIFTDAVIIYGDVVADLAALSSGAETSVPIPGRIVVGTANGKTLYLVGAITTVAP